MIKHKKDNYYDHVCEEYFDMISPDTFGHFPCCTKLWSQVTCKKCLKHKPKRGERHENSGCNKIPKTI